MKSIVCLAVILSLYHFTLSAPIDPAKLQQWRGSKSQVLDDYSIVRNNKITAASTDQTKIEWLAKVDLTLTVDSEIYTAFDFKITDLDKSRLKSLLSEPLKSKISPNGVKALESLQVYADATTKLQEFVDVHEIQHSTIYQELKPFHSALTKSVDDKKDFTPEQLKNVNTLLQNEPNTLRKCRQKIVKKAHTLKNLCDNVWFTVAESNSIMERIHSLVSQGSDASKKELEKKIFDDFAPKVKELNDEFVQSDIVKELLGAGQKPADAAKATKDSSKDKKNVNIFETITELDAYEKRLVDALNSISLSSAPIKSGNGGAAAKKS